MKRDFFKNFATQRTIIAILLIMQLTTGFLTVGATSRESIAAINNNYYLPPETNVKAAFFSVSADSYSVGNGTKTAYDPASPIDISGGETLDKYGNKCYGIKFYNGNIASSYAVYILSAIPTVYVETSTGLDYIHANKNNRDAEATMLICDENGNTVYSDESLEKHSEIKSRGNATFSYAKKPYQIKLGKKTDLFGMGEAKTWILLANYVDQSFLRNTIAFDIADTLGLEYSPKSAFVNLYIDGKFYGLYQLAEKTQIGKNRIDIFDLEEEVEKVNSGVDISSHKTREETVNKSNLRSIKYVVDVADPEDITGGYMIELDNLYNASEKSSFTTHKGNTYVVKSPECASREQVLYIATLFADMEEAIYSSTGYNSKGKHFSEYADVDSLVKMYITNEITKNWDAYVGSTYFYKDRDVNGKTSTIYAGPVWDFDHTFGNLNTLSFASDKTELWAAGSKRPDCNHYFAYYLIQHEECKGLLSKYAKEATDRIYEMIGEGGLIDRLTAQIYDSVSADRALWGYQRGGIFESHRYYTGHGTDSSIGFLTDFMKARADGIYKYFTGEVYGRHSWDEGTVTSPATCVKEGVITFTCENCGETKTEALPKTGHSYGAWTRDGDSAVHSRSCKACGGKESATHTWNGGVVTKIATHSEKGVRTYTCTVCKATKTESIMSTEEHSFGEWVKLDDDIHQRQCDCGETETADHTWDGGVVKQNTTHSEEGMIIYTCTTCGATKTGETANTTEHSFGEWVKLDDDVHQRRCACGKTETADHTWDGGVVTKEATHSEEGASAYTCTTCGATKTEIIAKATEHTYGEWMSDVSGHWRACTAGDGATSDRASHSFGEWKTVKEAESSGVGSKERVCAVCGYTETAEITVRTYKITSGADAKWTPRSKDGISFGLDEVMDELIRVEVDGNTVDPENYTVSEGSAIITFTAEFLKTLNGGAHTVAIVAVDGTAGAGFTVANAPDRVLLFGIFGSVISVIALLSAAVIIIRKTKRKKTTDSDT